MEGDGGHPAPKPGSHQSRPRCQTCTTSISNFKAGGKELYNIFEKKRDPSHNKCFSMSKLNEMFINAEFNILHTEKIIKKMDFPEWIDRPHIDQNIIKKGL